MILSINDREYYFDIDGVFYRIMSRHQTIDRYPSVIFYNNGITKYYIDTPFGMMGVGICNGN